MAHAVGALGAQPRTAAGRTGRLRLHGAGRRSPSSRHRRRPTDVRRRVQQQQLGHRGRKHEPLYGIRRLLLTTWANLSERGWERLRAGLATGDPDGDVAAVWLARELLAFHTTGGASNGPTEAVNLLIEKIRRIGHGYRNFDNYRRRILLGCGITWTTVPTRRIRGRQPAFAA